MQYQCISNSCSYLCWTLLCNNYNMTPWLTHLEWHIPYYYVITQYSLTKINSSDRSGMFLAVCYHIFLITMLLHITQYSLTKINGGDRSGMFLAICYTYYYVITQYGLTKIFGGDRLWMFLAVFYHIFLITVLLHNTVWRRSMAVLNVLWSGVFGLYEFWPWVLRV